MKKTSVKAKLVEYMISNGNDFRYTDMIKATLKIVKGQNYEYDYEHDRGFYATNFSSGANGYMVNGGGDCGVYKNEQGRWSAKYYTKEDKVNSIINRYLNTLTNEVSRARYIYDSNMNDLSSYERGTKKYSELLNYHISTYRNSVESCKSEAQNKIARAILKVA